MRKNSQNWNTFDNMLFIAQCFNSKKGNERSIRGEELKKKVKQCKIMTKKILWQRQNHPTQLLWDPSTAVSNLLAKLPCQMDALRLIFCEVISLLIYANTPLIYCNIAAWAFSFSSNVSPTYNTSLWYVGWVIN